MNIKEFLDQYKTELQEFDSQLLLAHVMEHPRTWLLAHLDEPLTAPQLDSAKRTFNQFQAGTPLPYILGHWEFYGLDFEITEDVLIPRPETELLVEKAIEWIKNNPDKKMIADIGTGSGVIAITLASHFPDVTIIATDISPSALAVARHNAQKFHVHHQIEFIECDLMPDNSLLSFDLICANLPYIPTKTLQQLPIYGREPTLALDGGADGLDLYRRLLKLAKKSLSANGMLLLEIEATQGIQAFNIAYDSFDQSTIHLHQDLAGHDRLLEIMVHEN
jgi:release factor glutamine methyltransferase